ncbi:type IV secretion system protein [Ralstonia pseudosolanacearum]|uniref:type IV secretion system protein n=1 Tax=Ralstonia pseudosolanacearum TaxID=1310165 RepID=UPI003CF0FB59
MSFPRLMGLIRIALLVCFAALSTGASAQADATFPVTTPSPTGSTGAGGDSQSGPNLAGPKGAVGEAISSALKKFNDATSQVINAAVGMSRTITPEAGKFAAGLGVITIVLAAMRFSASHHPITAWSNFLEEIATLGIFVSIYLGYERFAPGIYQYFSTIATSISGGDLSPGGTLATTAGNLWDSYGNALNAATWYQKIGVALSLLPLLFAFAVTVATSVIYNFYISLGQIQVAIGIVVGQLAVALGFSEFTRRYFLAWFDYMVSGSLYAVVAAIMSKLVTASFATSLGDVNSIGTDTMAGACYTLVLSIFLLFISFEIPSIAGKLFGNGAGISGGAVKSGIKAAWGLGKRMAG